MTARRLVLTVLLLALATAAAAADPSTPIVVGERFTLQPKQLPDAREIAVALPRGYAASAQSYPVLYLTDGEAHLLHTRGTVDFLARNGMIPDMIVVGVPHADRTNELTPSRASHARADGSVTELPTSGGADAFLAFLADEVVPAVEARYRTAPYRILAGHSFGGLLAVHAMLSRPDLAQAWIAVSPTLGWDGDLLRRHAEKRFAKRRNFSETLFVTMGAEGEHMTAPMDRFVTAMGRLQPGGFRLGTLVLDDEDHGTSVLRSHYHGLRFIFDGWRLPLADGELPDLAAVRAHYARLSERLDGWQVQPPEAGVNVLGYRALAAGHHDRAIELLRYNVELYPESANVYDSLGEALEAAGRRDEARAQYREAVRRGELVDDPNLDVFRRHLAALQDASQSARP